MAGRTSPSRKIDAGVPRRAILVGSLDWPPKRVSLEVFLASGRRSDGECRNRVADRGARSRPAMSPICGGASPPCRLRRAGGRRPAIHARRAGRAGAGPSGWFQAQGAGLRVQPPAHIVDADRPARHAVGGGTQHRSVRQPQRAGRRRCRADRRFSQTQCAAGYSPMPPAPTASTGAASVAISWRTSGRTTDRRRRSEPETRRSDSSSCERRFDICRAAFRLLAAGR